MRADLPMLILGGEKSVVFPPKVIERCAKSFGVSARIYDDMPHSLQQHSNWQMVADDIRDWLLSESL